MGYWNLVKPIWDTVSIYDGPETFLSQYNSSHEVARTLLAAHWSQSEINNGGFEQFFSNSTGVLAPEGALAFHKIGMPHTAKLIERAMALFDAPYPRDRNEREEALEAAFDAAQVDDYDPFGDLNDSFFSLVETENGGFETAADKYAALNG